MTREEIAQAVARGWCNKKNEHKTMDSDLAWAITDEVVLALTPQEVLVKKLTDGMEEIIITVPVQCDGHHQGDYACDLHVDIAREALGRKEVGVPA